ncbi:hypothetical protein GCM10010329_65580 [Streptomyces spiroverticillatus]|nr:hypothetical protein GCM10010329_65580 [Streptomyces spiroverticillatus]
MELDSGRLPCPPWVDPSPDPRLTNAIAATSSTTTPTTVTVDRDALIRGERGRAEPASSGMRVRVWRVPPIVV